MVRVDFSAVPNFREKVFNISSLSMILAIGFFIDASYHIKRVPPFYSQFAVFFFFSMNQCGILSKDLLAIVAKEHTLYDFTGEGYGNPLQYSCLENPMDKEAWWVQPTGSQRVRHDSSDRACTYKISGF